MQTGLRERHLDRRLALFAHQIHHSARRPANNIRPFVIFARALVAEGSYRGVNQARIPLREIVVAQPDRIEISELEGLDQKVALAREFRDHRAAIGGVEVGGYGLFSGLVSDEIQAAIESDLIFEEWRDTARRASPGRLDLNHFGAQIGEYLAAHRTLLVGE